MRRNLLGSKHLKKNTVAERKSSSGAKNPAEESHPAQHQTPTQAETPAGTHYCHVPAPRCFCLKMLLMEAVVRMLLKA